MHRTISRVIGLAGLMLAIVFATFGSPTHVLMAQTAASFTCPGAPTPRLAVGMAGQVTITPPGQTPLPVRVHNQPIAAAPVLFTMIDGTPFIVISGPSCADGYIWWEIKAEAGVGWAAEGNLIGYYLEPANLSSSPIPTAAAGSDAPLATAAPLPSATLTADQITDLLPPVAACPDTLKSRLAAGSSQSAIAVPLAPLQLHVAPSQTSAVLQTVQPSDTLEINIGGSGPQCREGLLWWQGTLTGNGSSTGLTGFFAEADAHQYFVVPSLLAARTFQLPVNDNPVLIDFGGVQLSSGMGQVGAGNNLRAEWIPAIDSDSPDSTGATTIRIGLCQDAACNAIAPTNLSVYQLSENTLLAHNATDAQTLIQILHSGATPQSQVQDATFRQSATVPWFAMYDAAFAFDAKFQRMRFQSGTIIRYLAFYEQAQNPVDQDSLYYVAEGVTDNGQRLFVYQSAIALDELAGAANNVPSDAASYAAYLKQVAAQVDATPNDQFMPSLDTLDAFVQSIRVGDLPAQP